MAHKNQIRKDKTCLNCNYVVENRFCSNCGQENSDTRKTFVHLFVHFFEDLTHYENAFWKTIKNLILNPASLTKEYLSGKRMSYLAPVRLYIFISFVTFFVISMLPKEKNEGEVKSSKNKTEKQNSLKQNVGPVSITFNEQKVDKKELLPQVLKLEKLHKEGKLTKKESDTLIKYALESYRKQHESFFFRKSKYKSVQELDSIQKFGKHKLGSFEYWIARKLIKSTKNKDSEEIKDKFLESFQHNVPKGLFIYMPIFAFLLWLIHSKKKWYYFDHGIFTLHYFSFLLTIVLLLNILKTLVETLNSAFLNDYFPIFSLIAIVWSIIYFFRAHKRFYGETKTISFIKSSVLFFLNLVFMFIIILGLVLYSFINIH